LSRYSTGEDNDDNRNEGLGYDLLFSDGESSSIPSSSTEMNIVELIREMKGKGIDRDPITFRNAILSCLSNGKGTIHLLDVAFQDIETFNSSVISKWGSIRDIKTYLINMALFVCARKGDITLVAKLFQYMNEDSIHADKVAMYHLIVALSSSGNCVDSMWVLNSMKGDGIANAIALIIFT